MLTSNKFEEQKERWNDYYIVGTPEKKYRVARNISPNELREKFKDFRLLPVNAFQQALSLMSQCPCATLIINYDDNFSGHRFQKKTEHVYINHFKGDEEFWI